MSAGPASSEAAEEAKYTGLALAVCGNVLIGISLNIQKYAHNLLENTNHETPFYSLPTWWVGVVLMVGGEIGNFVAFGFAPATLVSPLGAVSVIVNILIANQLLGEAVRRRDLLGVCLAIGGATLIVIFVPPEDESLTVAEVLLNLREKVFIIYVCIIIFGIFLTGTWGQAYSKRLVVVDVLMCSLLGSLTVISCKVVSTFLRLTVQGESQFRSPIAFFFITVAIVTGVTQVSYLNKAMANFDASEVVPVYYVMFTMCSISAGIVFFKEFYGLAPGTIVAFCAGCSLTFCGVYLITSQRRLIPKVTSGEYAEDVQPLVSSTSRDTLAQRQPFEPVTPASASIFGSSHAASAEADYEANAV